MTKNNKNADHLTFLGSSLHCQRCGDTHQMTLLVSIDDFVEELSSFKKRHADCKAPSKGGYRHRYAGSF